MHRNQLLTVSIASYNVEDYLPNCLDTLCASSMLDDVEIIVVDDGSRDRTAEIANSYKRRYPNSIKVVRKANAGYGSTINTSLNKASGKYYRLIDADDWVNTSDFDEYVSYLARCDADMVLTRFLRVRTGRGEEEVDLGFEFDGSTKTFDEVALSETIPMHMVTFKTEILKNADIRISEMHPYTDFEFVIKPIPYIETVAFCNASVYCYRLGRDGQSVSLGSWQRNISLASDVTLGMCSYYEAVKNSTRMSAQKDAYIRNSIIGSINNKFKYLYSIRPSETAKRAIRSFDEALFEASPELYDASLRTGDKRVRAIRMFGGRCYRPVAWLVSHYLAAKDK